VASADRHAQADEEQASRRALDERFPKKRVSAGGLIRDSEHRILVVKPTYRDGWLLPGGIVEPAEAPATALAREVHEELGLRAAIRRLLCVDYLPPAEGFGDCIHFLFECEPVSSVDIGRIKLERAELSEYRFCSHAQAQSLLVPSIARRLRSISESTAIYLHDGTRAAGA
jgi:8-oxo-dGTP diphosphatase